MTRSPNARTMTFLGILRCFFAIFMVEFTIGYLLNYNKFPDLFQFAYGNQKLPAICYYVVMKQRILAIVTDKSVQKFVAVGLISFAVDFGLLLISHYIF